MKRIIVLLLATACLTAAYLSGHSQQPAEPEPITFTKVGIVNMGTIYQKYDRVNRLRSDVEREVEPFKKKKQDLENTVLEWKAIAASTDDDVSKETRQMAISILVETMRQMQDLEIQIKQKLAKKLEDDLCTLDQSIREKIQTHGTALGYQIVLAYGEPQTPLEALAGMRRRMTVLDQGGMCVVYAAGGTDISSEVLNVLNREFREANKEDDE